MRDFITQYLQGILFVLTMGCLLASLILIGMVPVWISEVLEIDLKYAFIFHVVVVIPLTAYLTKKLLK